jgi:hypothetical protein
MSVLEDEDTHFECRGCHCIVPWDEGGTDDLNPEVHGFAGIDVCDRCWVALHALEESQSADLKEPM